MNQINEILNVFFKKDGSDINNAYHLEAIINSLIQGPLSKIKKGLLDAMNYIKENLIIRINNFTNLKDEPQIKKDRLFILTLTNSFSFMFTQYEIFINQLKKTYFKDKDDIMINKFLLDVSKNIKNEMNKTIQQFLDNSLSQSLNQIDVDSFISICNKMIEVCSSFFNKFSLDPSMILSKYESGNLIL